MAKKGFYVACFDAALSCATATANGCESAASGGRRGAGG